ncbi:MAG: hypothetical protein GF368_01540 [Candidatus Aenigmarchaeota archaeon]|nr:hypothetical protein [Candidatus Aenigmarchaeota archaeon]
MNEKEVDLTFKMVKEMMFNKDKYPKERFDEYRQVIKENLEKIRKELYKRGPTEIEIKRTKKPVIETREEIENWKEI